MVESREGFRTIFTAGDGGRPEQIVGFTVYRGHLIIATSERILEWDAEYDQIKVLEFVHMQSPSEGDMIAAVNRNEP